MVSRLLTGFGIGVLVWIRPGKRRARAYPGPGGQRMRHGLFLPEERPHGMCDEMLTGQRAFQGEDVSLTLASVMKSDVKVTTLPPDLPANVRTVLRRCLEKDVSQRVRDIGDVRLAMAGAFETLVSTSAEPIVTPRLQVWQRPIPAVTLALFIAIAAGLGVWRFARPEVVPPAVMKFALAPSDTAPFTFEVFGKDLVISPDGAQVIYTGGNDGLQLHLRPIDQIDGAPLRGGEGAEKVVDVYHPLIRINDVVELITEEVIGHFEFHTNASAVPRVPPPQRVVIR